MARFYGKVGYGEHLETTPGVYVDDIVEKPYYGTITRNTMTSEDGQGVNRDIRVGNAISILADAYANEHFFAIRYVEWAGALWTVDSVEVQRPRLLLRMGGVYNGPVPTTPPPGDVGDDAE